jgi:hypothetical protein
VYNELNVVSDALTSAVIQSATGDINNIDLSSSQYVSINPNKYSYIKITLVDQDYNPVIMLDKSVSIILSLVIV